MEQPSNLGRYQLLRILGRGAMGVVYEGIDPKLNRQVAVKTILKSQLVDPGLAAEYTARFMREAQAVARLNHPNIVQVFDFGNEADVTYLVMEFIRGKELKGYLEEKRLLGIDQVVHIVGDLLQALDYAHEHGVIHRDIKPANVMLDGAGRVKLTDFGVARLSDAGGSEGTRPGTMVGTPGYMAPEQIKGLSVGPQADIFATGVLLYQCLTLQKPFTGSSDWDVYHKIVNEDPPPLSQFRGGIPPALEAVVRRALAKEPKDRYPSAGAMANDLRQSVSGRTFDDEATRLVYDARPMPTAPDRTHITGTTNTVVSTPRAGTSDTERDFWNSIKDSGDIEELREFLNQFPDSVFSNLAKIRINKLSGQGTTGVDATQLKAAAEAEAERKAREETQRKIKEEARLKAEEEARRQAEQERQRKAQKEAQRQVEEETRRRAEQEAQKKAAATAGGKSEQEKQKEREDARRQEEARQKSETERQKAEEARQAEQEARRRAEELERQRAARDAEDARLRSEAEARRRAEEEARRRAEEETRRRAEEDARRRAEQDARAQEAARQRAEEEARRRAQEQARMAQDDGGDDSDRTVVLGRASPLAAAAPKAAPAAHRTMELPVAADLPDSVLAPISAEPLAPTRPAAGNHPQYSTLDLPGKKSKMPLIAGGAAVALIAVGALMFMGPGKDQATHAPQPTAQTPMAAPPSAPAAVPAPAPAPAAAPATTAADDAALKQKQAQEAAARKSEEQAAEAARQQAEADARKQAQADQRKTEAEAKARADETKKAAEAQKKEEARKAEEAKKKEEARKAEETRKKEEARKAEEAKKQEEARKKEEARAAFEASPEGILARARAARKSNNASEAIKLYAEAYNKGSGQAAKELGDYYQTAGPNQDPDAAALWYNRAKQKGIKTGK